MTRAFVSDNIEAVYAPDERVFVTTDSLVRSGDDEWQQLVEVLAQLCQHPVRHLEYDDPEVIGGIGVMLVYAPCWQAEDPNHSEVCPYQE